MFADTSVVIELLRGSADDPLVKQIESSLGSGLVLASPIQIGEIADHARKNKESPQGAAELAIQVLELVPLTPEIALAASEIKAEARTRAKANDFSLIDGVILASARSKGQTLLTLDKGFLGFPDVIVLDRNGTKL